jgi:hypothetical protein
MSLSQTPRFGSYSFEWTPEEAAVAASRAGLRLALGGGLTNRYVAPLTAFVLAMAFTMILAWTGLITRRHGEIVVLIAAAAYMLHRLWTRRLFHQARRAGAAQIEAMKQAGPVNVEIDENSVIFRAAAGSTRWDFTRCVDAEDAGGLVYLWPGSGAPAVLPTRVFADAAEATRFVAWARTRIANRH